MTFTGPHVEAIEDFHVFELVTKLNFHAPLSGGMDVLQMSPFEPPGYLIRVGIEPDGMEHIL